MNQISSNNIQAFIAVITISVCLASPIPKSSDEVTIFKVFRSTDFIQTNDLTSNTEYFNVRINTFEGYKVIRNEKGSCLEFAKITIIGNIRDRPTHINDFIFDVEVTNAKIYVELNKDNEIVAITDIDDGQAPVSVWGSEAHQKIMASTPAFTATLLKEYSNEFLMDIKI